MDRKNLFFYRVTLYKNQSFTKTDPVTDSHMCHFGLKWLLFFLIPSIRCKNGMNHLRDRVPHLADGLCQYAHQYNNKVLICKVRPTRFTSVVHKRFLSAVERVRGPLIVTKTSHNYHHDLYVSLPFSQVICYSNKKKLFHFNLVNELLHQKNKEKANEICTLLEQ